MNGREPSKPPKKPSIKPVKLSARPSIVRPARPSPRPRPTGPRQGGSVIPPRYGVPAWQHGIIKLQDLLSRQGSVRRRVEAATSGGTSPHAARSKGWETRRQRYGKKGRKS